MEDLETTETLGFIDAHTHMWSPHIQRWPLAPGVPAENLQPPSFTPEDFFAHAAPEGVERAVLIGHVNHFGWDNSYLLHLAKTQPEVFAVQASLDHTFSGAAERMKRLADQGAVAFRIRVPEPPPAPWDEHSTMASLFRTAEREGLAICPLTTPAVLPAFAALLEDNQDTRVVFDHFARIGHDGKFREEDIEALADLARFPEAHVKVSAFYAAGKKKPPYEDLIPLIQRLLEAFGAERLMWASDCPYQLNPGHTYAASIALVRDRLDLSDTDRDWLLRRTAERVYFPY